MMPGRRVRSAPSGHGARTKEDFGFYPEGPWMPLWGFKQRSNMIRFAFSKDFTLLLRGGWI